LPRPVTLRDGSVPADTLLVVRGGPLTVETLRQDCDITARRFLYQGRPLWGFSVEGTDTDWPVERILRDGRVRSRQLYATCSVRELRQLGCETLATFGVEPPHYTVRMVDSHMLEAVAQLLIQRTRANPNWTPR